VNRRVGRGGCGLDGLVMRPSFLYNIYCGLFSDDCSVCSMMAWGWTIFRSLLKCRNRHGRWKFSGCLRTVGEEGGGWIENASFLSKIPTFMPKQVE
jgi:hypothetical protein